MTRERERKRKKEREREGERVTENICAIQITYIVNAAKYRAAVIYNSTAIP